MPMSPYMPISPEKPMAPEMLMSSEMPVSLEMPVAPGMPLVSEILVSPEQPTFSEIFMALRLPMIPQQSWWWSAHWLVTWSIWAWRPPSLDRVPYSIKVLRSPSIPIKPSGLVKGLPRCWGNKFPNWEQVQTCSGGSSWAFNFCHRRKEWVKIIRNRRKTNVIGKYYIILQRSCLLPLIW